MIVTTAKDIIRRGKVVIPKGTKVVVNYVHVFIPEDCLKNAHKGWCTYLEPKEIEEHYTQEKE